MYFLCGTFIGFRFEQFMWPPQPLGQHKQEVKNKNRKGRNKGQIKWWWWPHYLESNPCNRIDLHCLAQPFNLFSKP